MRYITALLILSVIAIFNIQGDDMALKFENLNFDQGKKYWNVPDDFQIIRNGGRNATAALYIKRSKVCTPQETPKPVTRIIRLEHGKNYKMSAWIKANITQRGNYRTAASFSLHFYDKNGKIVNNIYPIGVMETTDWTRVEKVFTMYPGSEYCEIRMDLFHNYLGEVWFDSLQIEEFDRNYVYLIAPAPLVLDAAAPELLAGAMNTCNKIPADLLVKADLLRNNQIVATVQNRLPDNRMVKMKFPAQKPGSYQVKLELINKSGKVLATSDAAVVISQKKPRVQIGLDRVLRVDGKKFMVLGMYIGQAPDNELAMLQEAGFNTVMPYGSLSLNENYRFDGKGRETPRDHYTGDENNTVESITKVLDNMHKRDIKVIFSLINTYDFVLERFNLGKWQGVSGSDNIVGKVLSSFKDHPAMLAWYICDEMPASQRELIRHRREFVLEKDGDHPTWSVSMHFTELQHFFNTTDIMGTDAYPFLKHEHDLTSLEFAGQMVRRLNLPHFLVGQGFSWAYYEPVEKIGDIETWKRYRNPTESEMRSMCLSHALDGATGFLYYYFPAVTNPNIPIPNYRQDMLKSFKNVNIVLKKIERWILSGNDINMLEVKNLQGRVRAGVFTDENNQRCVLVVGGALGNQAEFELNGEFESMFGLCKKVNNKWVFTCDGVSSDILIEKVKK